MHCISIQFASHLRLNWHHAGQAKAWPSSLQAIQKIAWSTLLPQWSLIAQLDEAFQGERGFTPAEAT